MYAYPQYTVGGDSPDRESSPDFGSFKPACSRTERLSLDETRVF